MFGYTPRIDWNDNADGSTRSIDEAVSIARNHGVDIPDIAAFFVDELDELKSLDESITARGPKITKPPGGTVVLDDLLNKFGQVPFIVRE
jgi:hypothetical protein